MTAEFTLLSTDGCHLCDQAIMLCQQQNVAFEVVDIITDDNLVAVYGDKIPVLIKSIDQPALFWPFNEHQLNEFLQYYGIN